MKRNLTWVLMHTSLILIVVVNLLTGLRIATLEHEALLWFSALLPQGAVHGVHLWAGFSLVGLGLIYAAYHYFFREEPPSLRYHSPIAIYHSLVKWLGYIALGGLIGSGACLYFGLWPAPIKALHFACAIALVIYLPLHAGIYFIQYGVKALKAISVFSSKALPKNLLFILAGSLMLIAIYGISLHLSYQPLSVLHIAADTIIDIDGETNEPLWQEAETVTVQGFGAANFNHGRTAITIKALQNGTEIFFHVRWGDPTKSMAYMPLKKTEQGWEIQQAGFHHFDEKEFYEDKLALMFSTNCDFGASGSAHMGPKPLADKPANWHGKGYHYTEDDSIIDLWHWKAVRTNDMYQADDNFIGRPDIERPGSRRYTAGYQQDGKDSGAYVLNWKWYKQDIVTPKRLPKNLDYLTAYQLGSHPENNTELSWVIPWFSYEPYTAEKDKLIPPGTLMPSVMYTSNQFEGDRADVRAHAQWRDGYWSLEMVRALDTRSSKDIVIQNDICLWIAAFDHSQIAHTRHVRPLKLVMRK